MVLRNPGIRPVTGPDRTRNGYRIDREERPDPFPGTEIFHEMECHAKDHATKEYHCGGEQKYRTGNGDGHVQHSPEDG
jgi:hypothetical protein